MAFTKTQKNGYDIYTETGLVLADNAGTNAGVVTVTSALPDGINWENTKFPVTVDMTTVSGAAVVCDAILQTSTTGSVADDVIGTASAVTPSWVDSVAMNINVGSATTTNYSIECDASSIYAPYARLALTAAATDLTDADGRCTIIFAHKPSKPNDYGLSGTDIGGDGTTGVGPDPS
tara:strand:+ start:275 stop:805 length:531 start_codon:yes stop_codon:yes gene_type:complete